MLNKLIAAALTIGCMLDFEKRPDKNVGYGPEFASLDSRAELWVLCYKMMLRYMNMEEK